MKKAMGLVLGVFLVALGASQANATDFDFTTLNGGASGSLGTNQVTVNGISALSFADFGAGYIRNAALVELWLRNDAPADHGLGVCSSGEACFPSSSSGGGDVNELSQLTNNELIRLDKGDTNDIWTSLWVSSLDANGSPDGSGGFLPESGTLAWSNDPNPNNAWLGSFNFSFGDFGGSAEGDILTLAAASGFDPTARYLFFVPNGSLGDNNDYLVWKGATSSPVPEPTTLLLIGTGLLGAGVRARSRNRRKDKTVV